MNIPLTKLRANIFKYFEHIKKSGKPLNVTIKNDTFTVQYHPKKNLKALEDQGLDVFDGDIDELINIPWPAPSQESDNLL
jgi:hypothetical protein